MATITLTAGDLTAISAGTAGYFSGVAGSTSGGALADGFPDYAIYEDGAATSIAWICVGNAVSALSGLTHLRVDGVDYAVTTAPSFDGTFTAVEFAHRNFTISSNYTLSLVGVGAPANPNITSASTVINLVNTTLAHTITADKTIVSTAITGGADAASFEINGTNQLRFASNAASSALGSLVVDIQITDTDGLTDTQTITVTVKAIVYVGGKIHKRAGATSTASVSLTDLTGGIASAPAANDFVIAGYGIGSTVDRDVAITTGYAEQAEEYANGSAYDANLGVFTKVMPSTADTTLTVGSTGSTADAGVTVIHVFRGVDLTTPMDVAAVKAPGTGTGKPDPPAITPTTTGAVGVFFGAQAAQTAVALTSSDLTAFRQDIQADTVDVAVGGGYIEWTSGAINPAAFGGGASNAGNSWAAVSLALRPAWTGGGSSSALTAAATSSGSITGQRTASSPATATAAGSGSATGRATAQATASAAGTGTASAVGRGIVSAALSATASGAGSVAGASVVVSAGEASGAGVGSASLVGRSDASGSVTASAAGAVSAVGKASSAANATSTGTGSAAVIGTGIRPAAASATAAGSVAAVGRSNTTAALAASGAGSATLFSAASSTVSGAVSSGAVGSASALGRSTAEGAVVSTASGSGAIVGTGFRSAVATALATASWTAVAAATNSSAVASAAISTVAFEGSGGAAAAVVGDASGSAALFGSRLTMATLGGIAISGGSIVGLGLIETEVPAKRHATTRPGLTAATTTTTNRSAASNPDLRTATTSKGRRAA